MAERLLQKGTILFGGFSVKNTLGLLLRPSGWVKERSGRASSYAAGWLPSGGLHPIGQCSRGGHPKAAVLEQSTSDHSRNAANPNSKCFRAAPFPQVRTIHYLQNIESSFCIPNYQFSVSIPDTQILSVGIKIMTKRLEICFII